ncbi:MAG: DUF5702 domain-containing protein [Eubacterium sp.]|jgi:hypothetical protein
MIFMVSFVSMVSVFINESRSAAIAGSVESLGRLWASSILGEYDRNLYDRFGLMGFYGTEREISEKLDTYADCSFKGKSYIEAGNCAAHLYEYSLTDIGEFRRQVSICGAASICEEPACGISEEAIESDRSITDEYLLAMLPSEGRDDAALLSRVKNLFSGNSGVPDLLKAGTDMYFADRYIKHYFHNMMSEPSDDSFLKYEQEYLICGRKSDTANRRGVKVRIVAVRESANLAYLETDEEKKAIALAAAELIATPALAPAVQQTILLSWALAESVNDYEILIHGGKVPFVKTKENWATDFDSVNKEMPQDGFYIDNGCESGETYEDYLTLFITLMDTDVKYLRMMDLVQIDMQYGYYGNFFLKDYFTGLRYSIEVNGEEYEFEDEY